MAGLAVPERPVYLILDSPAKTLTGNQIELPCLRVIHSPEIAVHPAAPATVRGITVSVKSVILFLYPADREPHHYGTHTATITPAQNDLPRHYRIVRRSVIDGQLWHQVRTCPARTGQRAATASHAVTGHYSDTTSNRATHYPYCGHPADRGGQEPACRHCTARPGSHRNSRRQSFKGTGFTGKSLAHISR